MPCRWCDARTVRFRIRTVGFAVVQFRSIKQIQTIFAATEKEKQERAERMTKQSGMIAFAEQFAQAKVDAAQRLTSQYMIDTLQMTLHQTEGWGYERIMRLTEAWQQTQKEYTPALNSNDPAADVMQEHMDRVMAQIIGGKQELKPFPERYHELRKVTYGR